MPLYEKIGVYAQHLDERYAPYIDKLEAKAIVTAALPDLQVAPVIRVLKDHADITTADLGASNLLKAAHGCGWNIPLDGSAPLLEIHDALQSWASAPYSTKEKQYTYVKPRYFIESILDDKYTGKSGKARVFMVRCIHGKPVSVGVRLGNGSSVQNSYSPSFKLLEPEKFPFEKPAQWETLLQYAEVLAAPFEFVRMDFYIGSDEKIYFSEYTFTPAGGHRVFPIHLEHTFGKLWR